MSREIFWPDFVWSDTEVENGLRAFLRTLSPASNPYLRTPDELAAAGFNGPPYDV